jgi:CRP-like cAMP-binding protein
MVAQGRSRACILSKIHPISSDVRSLIAGAALFADLPPTDVKAIADIASLRRFSAGETVFSTGQFDGSELIFVASGALKSAFADPRTGSMVVESIGAGSFFALALAAVPAESRRFNDATITAATDAVAVFIDAEAMRALVSERPLLARALLLHFAHASAGGDGVEEMGPERRIFAAIASLVKRDAVSAAWRIDRMPKHRDLADLANVAEADAANAVAHLIRSGVARRDYPGLVIEDMARLNRLSR